ncbi:Serine/threonine-protein kinase HT1, partial [Leucoagaricus sp. SymC.cos]
LEGDKRRRTLNLLHKIAQSTQTVPQRLILTGVGYNLDISNRTASGGFSNVFKGIFNNRAVCIKVIRLDPLEREKLLKEHAGDLTVSANITHENILPFYGVHKTETILAEVSEWMENMDLGRYLKSHPSTPRIPLIADIISGLDHLHGMDIIHTNLTTTNVLISSDGRALLADFGHSQIATSIAMKIGWMDSVHWTAPEILLAEVDIPPSATTESDIWSFACTCYEVFYFPLSILNTEITT